MEFTLKFSIDWPEDEVFDKKTRNRMLKALKKGDYARLAQTAKTYLAEDTEFNQAVNRVVKEVVSFAEADMKKRRKAEKRQKLFDVVADLLDTLKTGA